MGIIFAGYQFIISIQANKEQTSVAYILESQSDKLVEARLDLQKFWMNYPVGQITDKPGSHEVIDELAMSFIFPSGKAPNTDNLIRTVEFLDLIGTCVSALVCDKMIMEKHFGEYVSALSCLYQAPLKRLRTDQNLSNLGVSMKALLPKSTEC